MYSGKTGGEIKLAPVDGSTILSRGEREPNCDGKESGRGGNDVGGKLMVRGGGE